MNETDRYQSLSDGGIAISPNLISEQDSPPPGRAIIHSSLAEERKLASKPIKPSRFFKLTSDGQWQRKSTDGKYNKLNAKRLLKKLQAVISKQIRRSPEE